MITIELPQKFETNDPILSWFLTFEDEEIAKEEINKYLKNKYDFGFMYIDPDKEIDEETKTRIIENIKLLDKKTNGFFNNSIARTNKILPIDIIDGIVYFLIPDLINPDFERELNLYLTSPYKFLVTFSTAFDKLLKEIFTGIKFEQEEKRVEIIKIPETEIRKILNNIIEQAILRNATDIHIVPVKNGFVVKLRIHGQLVELENGAFDDIKGFALINRIENDAHLPPTEQQAPRSGSIIYPKFPNYDFRLETVGTVNKSEKKEYYGRIKKLVVIRILEKEKKINKLDDLGFSNEQLDYIKKVRLLSQGMIILVGPTGSGKTTTLYSLLHYINDNRRHIITIENPVEYKIEGTTQLQVDEFRDPPLTFAKLLRSSLRLDPDVILVGEIRDEETAITAIQAAHTGHLVLTTLHANEISLIPQRIATMGINLNFFLDSIKLLISQRLVPIPCSKCAVNMDLIDDQIELFDKPYLNLDLNILRERTFKMVSSEGCSSCLYVGAVGRTVVSELMWINDDIRNLFKKYYSDIAILRSAINEYQKNSNKRVYFSMFEDGYYKLLNRDIDVVSLISILRSIE